MPIGTIQAEHLWKRFRADLTQPMLRDSLRRVKNRVRRRENPWTWVFRDVDLEVQPGEAVGLIGINGSGKSTLLKVLSRVMYPNSGRVALNGRIGALIEVRAGIHPDLTGRENVFFYGTILGLSRRQVAERFDTIVEFAELTDAVDRQVKFYSSGMGMRLGFSIAAFLEPDILLVDEVLAVGDIDFQQRCLERMREVRRSGTTVVFVSHDMAAVEAMCERALWMDRGVVAADGPTPQVVHAYRVGLEEKARVVDRALRHGDGPERLGLRHLWGAATGRRRQGHHRTPARVGLGREGGVVPRGHRRPGPAHLHRQCRPGHPGGREPPPLHRDGLTGPQGPLLYLGGCVHL